MADISKEKPRGITCECKCKCCGSMFTARVADRKRGWAMFCSKSCKAKRQEQRTGQYKAHLQNKGESHISESVDGYSEGWDEHKDWI